MASAGLSVVALALLLGGNGFVSDSMKACVVTTGGLFGLITLAHVWRMTEERQMATEPWYVLVTLAAGVLCLCAWRLVRRSSRS